jgi:multidrug efflux pump subunit AcrB
MNLTSFAFNRSRMTWFAVAAIALAGLLAYSDFPSQEEPTMPVRVAMVAAFCPGLSTEQTEDLIARRLEERIRELAEVKNIDTRVRTGQVLITVELFDRYTDLQPVWQRLRAKMNDARTDLPAGTQGPFVEDDYGRVAVASVAITAPGFSWAEIRNHVRNLRDRLYALPGVERITLHGLDEEIVYLETSNQKLARAGLSPARLLAELQQQNIVLPGGAVESGCVMAPIAPTGTLRTLEDLRKTPVTLPSGGVANLGDLAEVTRGLADPPNLAALYRGEPAVVLAVSMVPGRNVISFGAELKQRLATLERDLPLGFQLSYVTFQADVVQQEMGKVKRVFLETLAIVMIVVVVFVGFRTGWIVGMIVPLSLLMSVALMRWAGIELHNVSMAALIIALGLLVDNAIVIAEDVLRRLAANEERKAACIAAGRTLAVPLLTSSLASIFAFLPLMLVTSSTGEYTRYLSYVITIALLSSWLLSLTVTPLLCYFFAKPAAGSDHQDSDSAYQQGLYRRLRPLFEWVLDHRAIYLAGMSTLLVAAVLLFALVPQSFLPNSNRTQLQMSIELPPGSNPKETIALVKRLAGWLNDESANPEIIDHLSYVGEGGPRIVLSLSPPDPAPHTAYVIMNLRAKTRMEEVMKRIRIQLREQFPEARAQVQQFSFGMHEAGTVIYRIRGTEIEALRALARQVKSGLDAIPGTVDVRDDWENDIGRFVVDVDQNKARLAGVTSEAIALSMQGIFGAPVASGMREGDRTLPIIWRAPAAERNNLSRLGTIPVFSPDPNRVVPLAQVARVDYVPQPAIIRRHNLERTISVYGNRPGLTSYQLAERMRPAVERLHLPPGFRIEMGGEIEGNQEANAAIFQFLPVAVILLLAVFVWQFNSLRKVFIIGMSVPFCLIGVVAGMFVFRASFDFMAMLGVLALAGIIVSNAVLLLERIEAEVSEGKPLREAIVMASLKRLRPILMTKLTCVMGLVPLMLFGGPLWQGLSATIIGGLSLGTLVTLGMVPVLYSGLFSRQSPQHTFQHEARIAASAICMLATRKRNIRP